MKTLLILWEIRMSNA